MKSDFPNEERSYHETNTFKEFFFDEDLSRRNLWSDAHHKDIQSMEK
jgi:hypothetical protein